MEVILKDDIACQLRKVGLEQGDTVMVHTSLKRMGYVCGGAQTVIEALIEVVGDTGTILMPTQSWKNLDPEEGGSLGSGRGGLAENPGQLAGL